MRIVCVQGCGDVPQNVLDFTERIKDILLDVSPTDL
jgi:hypothetical protein